MGPPVQTTYPSVMPIAVPGMPATMTGWDADTKIVETVAGIGFGVAVSQGVSDKGIIIGGAKFRGVTYRDVTLVPTPTVTDIYPRYASAGVMVRGDIWVLVGADAVTAGDLAAYIPATGVITKTTGAGTPTAIAGGRFTRGAAAGGLALLRLAGPYA
jgi:hypothetical protein